MILKISEADVQKLVEEGKIPAYKIAGSFLRFREDQIDLLKANLEKFSENKALRGKLADLYETSNLGTLKRPEYKASSGYTFYERLKDFVRFYDFYIIIAVLVISLAVFIFYNF